MDLAVLEHVVRGVIEEQFAHILWLLLVLRGMGTGMDVLLCREAVVAARAVSSEAPSLVISGTSLAVGGYSIEAGRLIAAGCRVYAVLDDFDLPPEPLVPGVRLITRAEVPALLLQARRVHCW